MPRTPSPAAVHIGSRIRRLRRERDLTADQLAAATGINSSNIRSYEAGRALTSLGSLVRIAEALHVPPETIVEGLTAEMFARTTPA